MESVEFPLAVQQWANTILVWVGFGTIVALLAKAIMPGRDPGGTVATVLMGIGGTVIGCGVWTLAYGTHVTPISPMGFLVGTAGSFVILFFYKMLGGYMFTEGNTTRPVLLRRPGVRRFHEAHVDE
jgi:uncharacterized membrane protein YeaQ/YmgE (transglycosylase-associated protein family)